MSNIGCHFPLSYLIKFLTKSHQRPLIWLRFCHLPDVQGNPCFHPQTLRQQTAAANSCGLFHRYEGVSDPSDSSAPIIPNYLGIDTTNGGGP